jgi:ABC-type glycerol-3-phosphate transport system substrate-binding protein
MYIQIFASKIFRLYRGFPKMSDFGKAALDLREKAGRQQSLALRPLFPKHLPKLTEFWEMLCLCLVLTFSGCAVYNSVSGFFKTPVVVQIWTDCPEFALYAEFFNTSQNVYKAEVQFLESPSQKLTETEEFPDIVAGTWLKGASTRALFMPLDDLFKEELDKSAFYPRLLSLGNIDGKQYLLPVSFNIPALVFARSWNGALSNPFTISLEEIKEQGKAYNVQQRNGAFLRMGFSPAWNNEFPFITATLFNTSFREAAPIAWDTKALEEALVFIQEWINSANTGIQAEDDFAFKYFYDPPANLALSGRILFTYMNSAQFFTLPEEQRKGLDFRWIAEQNSIPLAEETVYYGIYKDTKAKKAARAFTLWFFNEQTQRQLLEKARNIRMNENHFGIAGGFSAMRTVTEHVFPPFYPSLLGRMPPQDFLSPPNILPGNWRTLKEKVILPYLHEKIRYTGKDEIRPLERRISEWNRLQR